MSSNVLKDNPADFSFYFDTSARRSCYLAPERFFAPGDTLFNTQDSQVTPAMDIFSLGCTVAEMFLEGSPLFTFSQLLRYRKGEYDLNNTLEKIEDVEIRNLIKHMTLVNPQDRYSAQEYLTKWYSHFY